jgi:glycosyltransferase involved in cell wall biosynthesis
MRVSIAIPVFNEERCLRDSLARLHEFLLTQKELNWEIVVVNNGSSDGTFQVASCFSRDHPRVQVVHLNQKGRGRALKFVWLNTDADIVAYMDADLSSDLNAFPFLIQPLISGEYDIATGSRLLKRDLTTRCLKREAISRSYNFLIKAAFRTSFSDAQCGFKALTRKTAQALLPQIQDAGWFFDTELLILGEKEGYRIFDLPIRWVERAESRVRILKTALDDLKGLLRLRRRCALLAPRPKSRTADSLP